MLQAMTVTSKPWEEGWTSEISLISSRIGAGHVWVKRYGYLATQDSYKQAEHTYSISTLQ